MCTFVYKKYFSLFSLVFLCHLAFFRFLQNNALDFSEASFFLFFIHIVVGPVVDHKRLACRETMKANGLTARFPGAVAHGIHSITLEDIRYYFKANATETNNVPTLNYDLSENATPVLPHAKLYGYDTSFQTISMRHLDQVLRDMDKKDWYLTNYNTLERLAHTIHMNEVWARAKVCFFMPFVTFLHTLKNPEVQCIMLPWP